MAAACAQVCGFYGLPMRYACLAWYLQTVKVPTWCFWKRTIILRNTILMLSPCHYLFPKIAYGAPLICKIAAFAPKAPAYRWRRRHVSDEKTIGKSDYFWCVYSGPGELLFLADEFAAHPLYVRTRITRPVWMIQHPSLRQPIGTRMRPNSGRKGRHRFCLSRWDIDKRMPSAEYCGDGSPLEVRAIPSRAMNIGFEIPVTTLSRNIKP